MLSLFLSNLETTVVSTSLVSITNALQGFQNSSWVVTAYLTIYTGFLIILAKCSDIFGRRPLMVFVLLTFIFFSLGCGLARSMTALAVLRGFQGIGGGGLTAMSFVILPEMVGPEKYPFYSALGSSTYTISSLLGPIIGGAINTNSSNSAWRWVFLLNVPGGAFALILILFAMPANFPYTSRNTNGLQAMFSSRNFRRIDLLGMILLCGGSILLVTALEEGGTEFSWHSAVTLTLLVVSIFFWLGFLGWERHQKEKITKQEPLFPWELLSDRFVMGILLNTLFAGAVVLSLTVFLPQRFQVVNGLSPLNASYRLLAFTITGSVGAAIAGILMQRLKVAPFYILIGSAILQTVGLILMTELSISTGNIQPATYGYEVMLGLGVGSAMAIAYMYVPLIVGKKNQAVVMGGIGQFRALGGSIGIAVCTNVLNKRLSADLRGILSSEQVTALLGSTQTLETLSLSQQAKAKAVYASGYHLQLQVMIAFSSATILTSLMLCERQPRKAKIASVGG